LVKSQLQAEIDPVPVVERSVNAVWVAWHTALALKLATGEAYTVTVRVILAVQVVLAVTVSVIVFTPPVL
ncbi:hypothetical protein NK983_32100, partial [Salmonella enterica subsp. enterica serovar Typhimurium]|nr:hypothetical protein [Salmonella enterica subsp. enterica serovar Typhimurium]